MVIEKGVIVGGSLNGYAAKLTVTFSELSYDGQSAVLSGVIVPQSPELEDSMPKKTSPGVLLYKFMISLLLDLENRCAT